MELNQIQGVTELAPESPKFVKLSVPRPFLEGRCFFTGF